MHGLTRYTALQGRDKWYVFIKVPILGILKAENMGDCLILTLEQFESDGHMAVNNFTNKLISLIEAVRAYSASMKFTTFGKLPV